MFTSLTDQDDVLGTTLLSLVSRGIALTTETCRLWDYSTTHLPSLSFPFLFTFHDYLHDPERKEMTLNLDSHAVDLDDLFQRTHENFLHRFYCVCLGIRALQCDFNSLVKDLKKGLYMSHTLEELLIDPEGKQLFPEAMHSVASALLLLNYKFPGKTREKLIVANLRMKGEAVLRNFDAVVSLVADVDYVPYGTVDRVRNENPAETLLARLEVDGRVARAVVSRLQADDIYGHARAWPSAVHRSMALANQAGLLFTALLLTEAGLKKKQKEEILPLSRGRSEMREIVDKHFADQWVVVVCTGFHVDLEQEWADYPAAKSALAEVVARTPALKQFNLSQAKKCQSLLDEYLTRGVLTERYVTDHWDSLLEVLRESNFALRWRILHGRTKAYVTSPDALRRLATASQQLDDPSMLAPAETIRLLLATAQLEHILRESVRAILNSKDETWKSCRERVSDRMKELSQYFGGDVPLAKVQRDEELQIWFSGLGEEICKLEYRKAPIAAGRRVHALISALEEVEKFDGVDASLQVREFLADSRALLERMVHTVNVRDELLVQIDVVSDLSYAWGPALDDYDHVWHARVRQDPNSVGLLRAVFVKLSSVLDATLARCAQAQSLDLESVADYWSKRLVAYVRRVLEVVPRSVCALLDTIGEVLEKIPTAQSFVDPAMLDMSSSTSSTISTRHLVSELGLLAAGEARYELAKCTHKISIFTGGMLTMGKWVVGVVEVDPKLVLDDSLRSELAKRMRVYVVQRGEKIEKSSTGRDAWRTELVRRSRELFRLRKSFEYVQDYVGLNGARAWNNELARVVGEAFYDPDSYLKFVADKLVSFDSTLDWTNDRVAHRLLSDVLSIFGVSGVVAIIRFLNVCLNDLARDFVGITIPSLSEDDGKGLDFQTGLAHLNLPPGVVWGTARWVDSIREARRKYPSEQMESDLRRLEKMGTVRVVIEYLQSRLARDCAMEAPLLADIVRQQLTFKDPAAVAFALAVGAKSPETGKAFYDIECFPPLGRGPIVTARRIFIVLSELAKRVANDAAPQANTGEYVLGPFGKREHYFCCAGVGVLIQCNNKFEKELERCAFLSARALTQKSLSERQSAEASLVFKFGAQKVAKVALERLAQEQAIHRLAMFFAGKRGGVAQTAPPYVAQAAELACAF